MAYIASKGSMKRYGKDIDLESEDINYTVSFSENNRRDFLDYHPLHRLYWRYYQLKIPKL
jgi:hypothetical protein